MDLPPLNLLLIAVALIVVGLVVLIAAAQALLRRRGDGRLGALVSVDAGSAVLLRSSRYRLSGRPDILRRLPDGRVVPIELKSRPTPAGGPPRSHLAQVAAYCLLVEETTGVAPPYGVLRYSDGGEFKVPWGRVARAELLQLRAELDRPYDGRATPSVAKCARCPWRSVCDVRAG
jgi:CRISPR-associated exonuclease Cas4